jgi:hypothetical protein
MVERMSNPSAFGWLSGTARRWFALVGGVATVGSLLAFAATQSRWLSWIAAAGLFLLALAFAMEARSAHRALGTTTLDLRSQLQKQLEASAERLEYLGSVDHSRNPSWFVRQYKEKHDETYRLIDRALGPSLADQFASTLGEVQNGAGRLQSAMAARGAYVRGLIGRLETLPIMGDWKP